MSFHPVDANGKLPTLEVAVDFTNDPTNLTRVWTDVTTDFRQLSYTRAGRSDALQQTATGSLTGVLNNRSGNYDPLNAAGAYYPGVKRMRWIRVRAQWLGVTYNRFQGLVTSWVPSWPGTKDSIVTIAASDSLKVLSLFDLGGFDFPAEFTGQRVSDVCAAVGLPCNAALENLVPNPSFEHDTLGVTPAGWPGGTGSITTFQAQNGRAEVGSQSARVTTGSVPAHLDYAVATGQLPVTAGEAYSFGAWVNGVSWTGTAAAQIIVLFYDITSANIGAAFSSQATPVSTWQQLTSVNQVAPVGAVTAVIFMTVQGNASGGVGDFYMDAVQMVAGVSLPAYFDGDSGGCSWTGTPGDSPSVSGSIGLSAIVDSGTISVGTSALSHLQDVESTENGRLFADAGGTIVFQDRHYRLINSGISQGTIGDAAGEIPYLDTTLTSDDSNIWNQAVVTPSGGTAETASDATSETSYYERTLSRAILSSSQIEALSAAQYLVKIYKDPAPKLPALTLLAARATGFWPTVLNAQNSQRFTFRRRPGYGGTINVDGVIEQVSDMIVPGQSWDVSLQLASGEDQAFWVLGDPANSFLGVTTAIGY